MSGPAAGIDGDELAGLRLDDEGRPLRPGGVTAVALLDLFVAAACLGAAAALAWWTPWGHGTSQARPLQIVAGLLIVLLLVAAPLHAAAAVGLLRMRTWGRWLQVGISGVGIALSAVGLYLHLVSFIYLVLPGMKHAFARRPVSELTADERASLRSVSGRKATILVVAVMSLSCVLTVATAAIIATIALPNFLNAVQRGKQKRTMGDIRTVATAIESYSIDHRAYPTATDVHELAAALEPTYLRRMPRADGWGHELRVDSRPMGYVLVSPGKDGTFEMAVPQAYVSGPTSTYGSDIVFSDGQFVRYPQGPQAAP